MLGLFGVIASREQIERYSYFIKENDKSNLKCEVLHNDKIILARNTPNKFISDKVFVDNGRLLIVLEGVILNSKKLINKYHCSSMSELIETMYYKTGDTFFMDFRGHFSGIVFDIQKEHAVLFTDHTGSKTIFYAEIDGLFVFASEVKSIAQYYKLMKVKTKLSLIGAYSLVSYAYMYEDNTLLENVKRLKEGHYIEINSRDWVLHTYYTLSNKEIQIDEREAVEQIDELFLKAVKLQANKNVEYGYHNYAALSAGLDSRMTTYALHRLNVPNILNFTYSESCELDCTTPMKIAKSLNNKWIFKSLDGGKDLINIDEATNIGDTILYYTWPAQLNDFMKLINTENMGIVHTGVAGDVVISSFYKEGCRRYPYKLGDGAYSSLLISKLNNLIQYKVEEDYEIGMYKNRVFNGANQGYLTTFHQYSEALSPFLNKEFLDFCLSMPLELRLRHNIYYKWVIQKYPEASKFLHNGVKISDSLIININNKTYKISSIPSIILHKLRTDFGSEVGMNPVQQWYNKNTNLRNTLDNYFSKNLSMLTINKDLLKDAETLYCSGNALEKTMVISLLASIPLLNLDN